MAACLIFQVDADPWCHDRAPVYGRALVKIEAEDIDRAMGEIKNLPAWYKEREEW